MVFGTLLGGMNWEWYRRYIMIGLWRYSPEKVKEYEPFHYCVNVIIFHVVGLGSMALAVWIFTVPPDAFSHP